MPRHLNIESPQELDRYCDRLEEAEWIAFDTEFVSEDTYRPQLSLIQVATDEGLAIIDPVVKRLDSSPFWEVLTDTNAVVIAHAAREEIRFAHRYGGHPIENLFDTQLAAGFVGIEYPASLGNLVHRIVGKTLPKGETRTNWNRRPLSTDQVRYALSDVTELKAMHDHLRGRLEKMNRTEWYEEEAKQFVDRVIEHDTGERWRKMGGTSGFQPRQLECLRQIWLWREDRAKQRDRIARRILRDDLMVELAKKSTADPAKIRNVRGMERKGTADQIPNIADAIQVALDTPESELPKRLRSSRANITPMLSQFLSTSIACISRQHKLAPAIVGNSEDVKALIAYELGNRKQESIPALLKGWRGEVVGKTFKRLLDGELAITVDDVNADQPLAFVEV
ncbi:MAG: HRDC domain-containing protein [Planctomycetota bacterium]